MNSKLLFGSFSALLLTGGMIFTTGCESIDDDPMPPGAYVPPATVDPIAVKGGENAPAAPVGEPVVLPAPEPAEPVFIVQPPAGKPAPQKPLPPKKARKPQPKKRQAPAETSTHIIKKGESFWSIAALYGIEMDDIAAANPKLNPKKLHVGGKLIIPGAAERKERAAKAPKKVKRSEKRAKKTVAKLENEEGVYIVRNGDSLSRIAARHHVKVSALAAANNINVDQMLRIGQKLVIPKPGKAVKPAKKTTAKPVNTASNKAPKKTSEPASATETAVPPTPSSDLFPQSAAPETPAVPATPGSVPVSPAAIPALPTENSAAVPATPVATPEALSAVAQDTTPVAAPATGGYTTNVDEDTTLEELASRYGYGVMELKRLNPEIPADGKVRAGSVVKLP